MSADAFDRIEHQPVAVAALRRALASGRVAHAYLFEGPSGVGKGMAALALADAMVAGGNAEVSRRIERGEHPDVRVLPPRDEGSRNLPVEFVREELLHYTKFAPFEADAAFLIFPEADISFPDLHPEGANTLLKTLEEPRHKVHFVLLSERPDRLLPTIRSRCQRLRFAPLPRELLAQLLSQRGIDDETARAAIALSGGSADQAIALADKDAAQRIVELVLRVDAVAAAGEPGGLVTLGEELAREHDLEQTLRALTLYYRDLAALSLQVSADRLCFSHRAELLAERCRRLSASEAAQRVDIIRQARERLAGNANPQIAMDALLSQLG